MNSVTAEKEKVLRDIAAQMDAYSLSLKEIKLAYLQWKRQKDGKLPALSKSELVVRLFVYIGGAFIFAGLGTFVAMIWDDIASLPRVIITLGPGLTAFILGILFTKDTRYEKAATPAFIIAFLLQPTGFFVLLHEYFGGGSPELGAMVVFGVLTIQQGLIFSVFKRQALLFGAIVYFLGFIGGCIGYFEWNRPFASLVVGVSLLALTFDLLKRPAFRDLSPFFFLVSTALFFGGLYYYTGNAAYDPVNLACILALLALGVTQNSRTLYILMLIHLIIYLCDGPGGGWYPWSAQIEWAVMVAGASVMLTGQWLRQYDIFAVPALWFFFGMGFALGGAYGIVHDTTLEILFIAMAASGIYISLLLKSRAALAAATLSLISYIVYFSEEHFADVIGWPLLMIALGFMMLGGGFAFVKLGRRISTAAPDR